MSKKAENVTGFKGVKKDRNGKFQGQLTINNKGQRKRNKVTYSIGLGTFNTPAEAYQARVEYIKGLL